MPATDAAASFFDALSDGGPHPLLAKARGALRFDVRDGNGPATGWSGSTEVTYRYLVDEARLTASCAVRRLSSIGWQPGR